MAIAIQMLFSLCKNLLQIINTLVNKLSNDKFYQNTKTNFTKCFEEKKKAVKRNVFNKAYNG